MPSPFLTYAALVPLALHLATGARAQALPDDRAMIAGFESVVFGAEIAGETSDTTYVKKFVGPVRFAIDNLSLIDRRPEVEAFLAELDAAVDGLEIEIVEIEDPNFVIHVVDRLDYQTVGQEIYGDPTMPVPGNCIVRASYSPTGIRRSDAIIVSDEGRALFTRCLVEEVLQGLGPLNDNADAPDSVFNDTSTLTEFTPYDRTILSMLYDPRLRPGMRIDEAAPLLPAILADIRRADD